MVNFFLKNFSLGRHGFLILLKSISKVAQLFNLQFFQKDFSGLGQKLTNVKVRRNHSFNSFLNFQFFRTFLVVLKMEKLLNKKCCCIVSFGRKYLYEVSFGRKYLYDFFNKFFDTYLGLKFRLLSVASLYWHKKKLPSTSLLKMALVKGPS